MNIETILTVVTMIITFIAGIITKNNKKISNKIIPIQNLIIGFIMAVIEWIITKDFSQAIFLSGLLTGGTYDLGKNLREIMDGDV